MSAPAKMRVQPIDRARLAVGVGAAALRLVSALLLARPPQGVHDPLMYHRFAWHISWGRGYASWYGEPTAYYPPGYPWFLGVQQTVLKAVGAEGALPRVAPVIQALIGGFAAWALVGFASRTSADPRRARRIGLVAGTVFALWPNLILHSAVLLSESLFLGFVCAFLLGMARLVRCEHPAWSRGWWGSAVLAGVGLGAATLTRPQVLLSLPGFAVAIAVLRIPWRRRIATFAVPAVIGAAVVMPWTIRNWIVFDHFVAVSTNGGDNLCIGFNRDAQGFWFPPEPCETGEFYLDGPAAEYRRNKEAGRRAREWALEHLDRVPWLSWRKLVYTYETDTDGLRAVEGYGDDEFLPDAVRTGLKVTSNGYYAVVMALTAGGLVISLRGIARGLRAGASEAAWRLGLVVGGFTSALVPVLFFGDPRFKVPSVPFFAVFVGCALAANGPRRSPDTGTVGDDTAVEPAAVGAP